MGLPHDLKNYSAGFQLFTEEEAGLFIGALVVISLLLDYFEVFAR